MKRGSDLWYNVLTRRVASVSEDRAEVRQVPRALSEWRASAKTELSAYGTMMVWKEAAYESGTANRRKL